MWTRTLHVPAYFADGYNDACPLMAGAAYKCADKNGQRRDFPGNGLSVNDWYLRNNLYIDAR